MADEPDTGTAIAEYPLGNPVPFVFFLAANGIWLVACSLLAPVASLLVAPENGDLAKMRLAAVARILALPLFLPLASIARSMMPSKETQPSTWHALKWALLLLPLVTVGSYTLMAIFQLMASNPGEEHPLTQLFRSGSLRDAGIVVVLVVIIAPVTEEVLFRGFFQTWITSARLGPLLGWCMSLALVACFVLNPKQSADPNTPSMGVLYSQVAGYLLTSAALILLAARYSHRAAAAVGGAMVFTAVHAFAWPSPAGLLPLACGLAWLREVTGRLWPGMLVHAVFNGFGTLLMMATN